MTTNSFEIADAAYNLLWYEMSVKQQKSIILIIARSQREFRLTGLQFINCSMEIFLVVKRLFLSWKLRLISIENNYFSFLEHENIDFLLLNFPQTQRLIDSHLHIDY